jgi:hypothetical protein
MHFYWELQVEKKRSSFFFKLNICKGSLILQPQITVYFNTSKYCFSVFLLNYNNILIVINIVEIQKIKGKLTRSIYTGIPYVYKKKSKMTRKFQIKYRIISLKAEFNYFDIAWDSLFLKLQLKMSDVIGIYYWVLLFFPHLYLNSHRWYTPAPIPYHNIEPFIPFSQIHYIKI